MKNIFLIPCLFVFSLSSAQLVPCFEDIPTPERTEIQEAKDNGVNLRINYYTTGMQGKLVTDTIFTIDPETREQSISVVQRSLRIEEQDQAEIQVGNIVYYYFRPPGKKCFRVYRSEESFIPESGE